MALTLIIGPMKSGKSLELIARVEPLTYTKQKVLFVQPKRNVRDRMLTSRTGLKQQAQKVSKLSNITGQFHVIAIDEIHMFESDDAKVIESWVNKGIDVYVSGLDLDYRGDLMEIVKHIFELKPDEIIVKKAVCEVCHIFDARFTQLVHKGKVVTSGLSAVVPEDGSYNYRATCRNCFIR